MQKTNLIIYLILFLTLSLIFGQENGYKKFDLTISTNNLVLHRNSPAIGNTIVYNIYTEYGYFINKKTQIGLGCFLGKTEKSRILEGMALSIFLKNKLILNDKFSLMHFLSIYYSKSLIDNYKNYLNGYLLFNSIRLYYTFNPNISLFISSPNIFVFSYSIDRKNIQTGIKPNLSFSIGISYTFNILNKK